MRRFDQVTLPLEHEWEQSEGTDSARCRVVILTFNCEEIIGETLAQARRIDARPFVVDSFSTDRTIEILRDAGCECVQRRFDNYADQRNWAIREVAPRTKWQLHLDADEVMDDEAVTSVKAVVDGTPPSAARAYMLRRVDYFMGRRLRHSGLNPWHLRLFRSGDGACEDRLYDQHFVAPGPVGRLEGCMHDRNSLSLSEWTARHNRWSELEVAQLLREIPGHATAARVLRGRLFGDPRERARWMRKWYYRLPVGLRGVAYFVYRYFLRLGVLDGREGFYFSFLQAFWFRVLIDAKLHEARRVAEEPVSQRAEA